MHRQEIYLINIVKILKKGYFIPGVSPIKVTDVYRAIPIDKKTGLRACYYDKETTEMQVYEFWPSDITNLLKNQAYKRYNRQNICRM